MSLRLLGSGIEDVEVAVWRRGHIHGIARIEAIRVGKERIGNVARSTSQLQSGNVRI
jgi:hypothetical protein